MHNATIGASIRRALTCAALAALPVMGIACERLESDSAQADRRASTAVREAAMKGPPAGSIEAQIQSLNKAVGEAAASSATKAQTRAALAQVEVNAANHLLAQADALDLNVARGVWEMDRLGAQIDWGNKLVAGYRKFDPKPGMDAVTAKKSEAQGSAEAQAWFSHGSATIPTLAAAKAEADRLNGEIAQREKKLADLEAQRRAALDEAEKAARAADASDGKKWVDEYNRATDLRKQAADLLRDMDVVKAELLPLMKNLAIAEGQMKVLGDAIKLYDEQGAQLQSNWKAIQAQIDAQHQLAKKQVEGDGKPLAAASEDGQSSGLMRADSIAGKAAIVTALSTQARTLRDQAAARLDNAAKLYNDAYQAATSLDQELRKLSSGDPGTSDKTAWGAVSAAFNPDGFKMQRALVEHRSASLYASRVHNLWMRLQIAEKLEPILRSAGLSLPSDAQPGDMSQRLEAARNQAQASFNAANETLLEIQDGTLAPEAVKTSAKTRRMLVLSDWGVFDQSVGKAQEAANHFEAALDLRKVLTAEGATLPVPLPEGLGEKRTPSAAPSPGPASAPPALPAPATSPENPVAPDGGTAPGTTDTPAAPAPEAPAPEAPAPETPAAP